MGEEDSTFVVIPKKDDQTEDLILEYIFQGWQDGEYSSDKIKS